VGEGLRSSVCPEVIVAAVWPPGAEVVVAAAGVGGDEPPRILLSRRPSQLALQCGGLFVPAEVEPEFRF
jgi:hypothetical protein